MTMGVIRLRWGLPTVIGLLGAAACYSPERDLSDLLPARPDPAAVSGAVTVAGAGVSSAAPAGAGGRDATAPGGAPSAGGGSENASGPIDLVEDQTLFEGDERDAPFVPAPCEAISPPIAPCPLPPPCAGTPYSVRLEPPLGHTLAALELPAGLSFDPSSNTVTGLLEAAGTLRMQVNDATGAPLREIAYDLAARDSCWFGFVSTESGPPALHLVDTLLASRISLPPTLESGAAVTDFAFSADGRYLALREVDALGAARLRLFAAPAWSELPLEVPGSVTGFAWSPHGALLALSLERGQGAALATLRLPSGALALTPAPERIDAPLTWVGESAVAYHALGEGLLPEDEVRSLRVARVGDEALGPIEVHELTFYAPGLRLFGDAGGFYVLGRPSHVQYYELVPSDVNWLRHPTSLLSPGRRYTAAVSEPATLRVHRGNEHRFDEAGLSVPLLEREGCERLLAWSPNDTRLACVLDDESGGELRIFELDEAEPALTLRAVDGDYRGRYSVSASAQRRRAFSPQGNWFAFASEDALHLADLRAVPFVEAWQEPLSGAAIAALSFSPDEQLLAVQLGDLLGYVDLAVSSDLRLIERGVRSAGGCSDGDDVVTAPEAWCGSAGAPELAWSPTSLALAFTTTDGALHVIDLQTPTRSRPDPVCTTGCALEGFAFQPATPTR